MTFKGFKNSLSSKLIGDVKLPSDELLKPLIKDAIEEVAEFCEPLHLITDDLDFEVLKILTNLDDGMFIRSPRVPQNEDDNIDIDEKLSVAVVFLVASYIARTKNNYSQKANKLMLNYIWDLEKVYEVDYDE